MNARKADRCWYGFFAFLLAVVTPCHADDTQFLWEVHSATATVYLLGTIHVGRPEYYPLPAAAEHAYRNSSLIALEVDPGDQQALVDSLRLGTYQAPQSLEKNISRATFDALRSVAATVGIPLSSLKSMKPFFAALMLTSHEYARLGYDLQLGVDVHLASRATHDGKKLLQLESARSQMEMMAGLSKPLQESLLEITLREISTGTMAEQLRELTSAWKAADADRLQHALAVEEQQLPAELANEFHDKFLTRRNVLMTERIELLLAGQDTCLVAIGAGHLLGEDGLPAALARKGYQVRRQ
jgi:uncharacterized protein